MHTRAPSNASGLSLIELLFALMTITTIAAMAVPMVSAALDQLRTAAAARYIAARLIDARIDAVRRSACVAVRFELVGGDYQYAAFRDGNDNGVRTADIRDGVDAQIGAAERVRDQFPGTRFLLQDGIPDIDGNSTSGDGVRIGTSRILTMSPDGTATAGTLYLAGRRAQFAVRVLGPTGRVRVLKFDTGGNRWMPR